MKKNNNIHDGETSLSNDEPETLLDVNKHNLNRCNMLYQELGRLVYLHSELTDQITSLESQTQQIMNDISLVNAELNN